ncbi:putative C-S lyase [Alteromonas aestuariivivens]|uniref:cysteine-S-conjugate beta-lyase n=1 Tax=Alteromonas aestuariivivens TaxID=1938339 RepID=A0A3D8MDZ0_9ALTE|nr:PatB family C-S lyase [Alteromonas aestuariivivens]RDV28963.1 putative C-S lyase [Alteromonas aestuariivivens]
MSYSFDNPPSRQGTFALKWQRYEGKDIIPTWIADTEFRCADPILEALNARVEHGNLGYTLPANYEPANRAVMRWLRDKHGWKIEADWIVWNPGVVPAFNVVCKAFCEPGDKVIVQTPNYPPLLAAPRLNGLERIDIGTVEREGRWTLDFDALQEQAADPKAKLLILCNPMNPVGSVFTREELDRVADICQQNDVLLCSDEIHCDLILDTQIKHVPAGKHPLLVQNSITLMAASKTFNVAGLGTSFAIIPNRRLRQQFTQAAAGIVPWANVLGLVATEAAFTQCDDWHQAELEYLRENRRILVESINAIKGLRVLQPQATFLAWIDASGLGVDNVQKWAEERGVGPSPGADFGNNQCFRINYGCSRAMLKEIVSRLSAK